jgi:hypothetical protein
MSSKNKKGELKTREFSKTSFDKAKAVNELDIVFDERFSQAQNDPRFMRMPRTSKKVKIDDRFKKMFDDENFSVYGGKLGKIGAIGTKLHGKVVDKYGRRTGEESERGRKEKAREDLNEYYDLEEEEEEEEGVKKEKKGSGRKGGSIDVDRRTAPEIDEDLARRLEKSRDRMRGVGLGDSSSSSSGSGSDDDDDDDDDSIDTSDDDDDDDLEGTLLSDSEEGVLANYAERRETGHESSVPEQEATKRLALVNCEWQQIRAVDILTILRSFCSASLGKVEKVSVYPSDFGLERMNEENSVGPMGMVTNIRKSKYGGNQLSHKNRKKSNEFEFGKEGKEVDNEQLRQYERDRLKYYYAIIECDSVKTAKSVYEQCDGLEFERSSALLDLRYVPNDQDFSKREVRDSATETPDDYEPPEFEVKALRNSNVKLSWDINDPARKKTFGRKITEDKLKDDDFNAYLASDSENESSEDEETEKEKKARTKREAREQKKKYLAALLGKDYKSDRKGVKLDDIDKDDGPNNKKGSDDDDDFFLNDDDNKSSSESSSSDAIEDTALASTKYAMQKKFSNRYGNKASRNDNQGDMEVTFHAGLEDFGTKMKKKKKDGTLGQKETAEEKRERERREKKLAKKMEKKSVNGSSGSDKLATTKTKATFDEEEEEFAANEEDEGGFDDPFFTQEPDANFDFDSARDNDDKQSIGGEDGGGGKTEKKKKKRSHNNELDEEELKAKAELELLMMDENAILGKGNAQSLKKNRKLAKTVADEKASTRKTKKVRLAEKRKLRGKAARRVESDDEMDDDDDDNDEGGVMKKTINVQDDRFGALFENHEFALDPTDPRYKDVESKAIIALEREKRRAKKLKKLEKMREEMLAKNENGLVLDEILDDGNFPSSNKKLAGASNTIGKNELDNMIQSLKRKQAAMQKKKV